MESVYLDYAASNPIDPRVREAVLFAVEATGNPSSVHAHGRILREAIDSARESVAELLGVGSSCVHFTSGATEANNLAIRGYFRQLRESVSGDRPMKLLISAIEHPSVREVAKRMQTDFGVEVKSIPVDKDGVIRIDELKAELDEHVAMVCVMWANNVVGSLQPIAEIGEIVKEEREKRGAGGLPLVFMSDAVQALRTEEVRPSDVGVDMLTLSGHKIYGPKGIGAIFIDKSVEIVPLVFGGGQESGMRGGTENVPGIIGLGRAADILRAEQEKDREKVSRLQARFFEGISGVDVFGNIGKLMPGICYVSVFGEKGDITALKMDSAGIAVSSGSACDAGTRKSSSVLREAGVGNAFRDGGIRVSFGRFSEERDIDAVVAELQR